MKIELELWHLITMLASFFGCVAAFGKILLDQFEKRLEDRFKAYEAVQANEREDIKANTEAVKKLERDFLEWQANLPLHYVRREDYVRGQAVIEAKLDTIYSKLETVQLQGARK